MSLLSEGTAATSDRQNTLERELKEVEEPEDTDADDDIVGHDNEEERWKRQMGVLPTLPLLSHHREELLRLSEKFLSFHQWKGAAAIISQLFRLSSPGTISDRQLRRLFMAACEIQKQIGDADNFHNSVRQIFEGYIEQMQSPEKIASAKLEIANFYFSEGAYDKAYDAIKNAEIAFNNLAQDKDKRGNPFVNLTFGLICYKRWYTNAIPEDMKLLSCDESFTTGASQSVAETGYGSPIIHTSLVDSSVFHARGLNVKLLPIRLRPMHEDLEYSIQEYRQLSTDEEGVYEKGVECLTNALHSSSLKSASLDALEPLIQLLLLGDRVAEAANELRFSCSRFSYSAIPFSLRARFLESFAPQEIDIISTCYHAALKIDPTCTSYIEGLIRIYSNRSDEHSMKVLLEMIPLHIDAMVPFSVLGGQDGAVGIGREVITLVWEELASCFLKVSNIFQGIITSEIFSERAARATWKTRFCWWKEKHFREISLSSQAHSGISEQAAMSGMSGASNESSDLNKQYASSLDHHYKRDQYDKIAATCNYCNTIVRGRLQMKKHLIGKTGLKKTCNGIPQHKRIELKKLLHGKDRDEERHMPSLLHLLPGDDELLARKAACACHLYGPGDEYVVEILKILSSHGFNDHNSFLQTHMQSALNLCGLLGTH